MIGCGNLPAYSHSAGDVHYIDDYGGDKNKYRAKHRHDDADSMDPDFARNLTFLGTFGETPVHELFNGHKYKEINIEGIRILPWDMEDIGAAPYPHAMTSLIALLDDDGVINDNGEGYFTKAQLVQYLKDKQRPPRVRMDSHHHHSNEEEQRPQRSRQTQTAIRLKSS